jgi:hypothetical protein
VFSSCKTLIKKILSYMVEHTLEKFVLLCVNATISITITFDLWMSKGALDTFAQV